MNSQETIKHIQELFDNFPEYVEGSPYICRKYDYKNGYFDFLNDDTGQNYLVIFGVNNKDILKAYKGCVEYLCSQGAYTAKNLEDGGNWDAPLLQTLLDFVFYGKAVHC